VLGNVLRVAVIRFIYTRKQCKSIVLPSCSVRDKMADFIDFPFQLLFRVGNTDRCATQTGRLCRSVGIVRSRTEATELVKEVDY
jgi:hypothetical protein